MPAPIFVLLQSHHTVPAKIMLQNLLPGENPGVPQLCAEFDWFLYIYYVLGI